MLYLRMVLYFAAAAMAGQGLVIFDQESGTVTFRIDDVVLVLSGVGSYLATFAASRWAKVRGGQT